MVINTDLTHLPEGKQHTIAEIRRVILNEIEGEAVGTSGLCGLYCLVAMLVALM